MYTPFLDLCPRRSLAHVAQKELEKERKQAQAELAARDLRINSLFEELTATQSEVAEAQQQLEQVRAICDMGPCAVAWEQYVWHLRHRP